MTQLQDMTQKALRIKALYAKDYPDVTMDRDYTPFKITEEWGECMQTYLMFTDRGRQKDYTKDEIKAMLRDEMADVFGHLLIFADQEGIDLVEAMEQKWFRHLQSE